MSPIASLTLPSGQSLALYHGDLTKEVVDAIVNAANERLAHGGGLAAAIVRAGGPSIQRESNEWLVQHGRAGHDKPALTGAGKLPCRFVIHAVGPMWGSGDEDEKLRTAYQAALELAHTQGFQSVAFPSLSTGIFGFPVARAAPIAVNTIHQFLLAHADSSIREVRFTLIDTPTVNEFRRAMDRLSA